MTELSRTQRYYQENKERFRETKRRSRENNREWVRQQARECEARRYRENPQTRIKASMGSQLRNALINGRATSKFEASIGCTAQQLIAHLEKLFVDGMSWENRGRDGWHVDHKRPLSSFDLTDPEQFAQAFHFTNTQPLWADENRRKWKN